MKKNNSSFGKSKSIKELPTSEKILNYITDQQIFEYYLGGIPKKSIHSPLREDNIPSFNLFYSSKYNKIMFIDYATKDIGDAFVFVMKLFNFSKITDAFEKIVFDFNLDNFHTGFINKPNYTGLKKKSYVSKKNKGSIVKDRIDIKVKRRSWKIKDRDYWFKKYGLNPKQLEYCGVFPISHFFLNHYCKKSEELAYAFLEEKDGIQTFKIYQPFSSDYKWINNNDYSVWELWTQMPKKGKNLIITSSRKDAMVIKSLFNSEHITSVSLQSEGVNPKDSVIDELRGRFDNIYVLYDNDYNKENNPGRLAGIKFAEQTGFKQIEIDKKHIHKDISDFREFNGSHNTRKIIIDMIC